MKRLTGGRGRSERNEKNVQSPSSRSLEHRVVLPPYVQPCLSGPRRSRQGYLEDRQKPSCRSCMKPYLSPAGLLFQRSPRHRLQEALGSLPLNVHSSSQPTPEGHLDRDQVSFGGQDFNSLQGSEPNSLLASNSSSEGSQRAGNRHQLPTPPFPC